MRLKLSEVGYSPQNKHILESISFTLPKKELVMLVGPNGSGKTTLMRIMTGLLKSTSGEIWYGQDRLAELSTRRRAQRVSYMPQIYRADVSITVSEFILLGAAPYLSLFQIPGEKERDRAAQILKEFQIWELRNTPLERLSGGERQYVYFARVRMQQTEWMILDEPMAALDYGKQQLFIEQLKRYKRQYQQGILLSVHDPNYALESADRVILLDRGGLVDICGREQEHFEETLTEKLKRIYGQGLTLGKINTNYFYFWDKSKL